MGCCSVNKKKLPIKFKNLVELLEKDPFKKASKRISISLYDSRYIDEVVYKNSVENEIDLLHINQIANELLLNDMEQSCLLKKFNNAYYYQPEKLSTLGVLLGKGTANEKLNILFKNYSKNIPDHLTDDEVERMINDIFYVACIYIPNYCIESLEFKNKDDYIPFFVMFANTLKNYYKTLLIGNEKLINIFEFLNTFKDQRLLDLLSDDTLRQAGSKYLINVLKKDRSATASLD